MKSYVLTLVGVTLLFSCQKQDFEENLNHETETNTEDHFMVNTLLLYMDNGADPGIEGVDYGCFDFQGYCAHPVVVTPVADVDKIDNVIDAVNAGVGIAQSFSDNEAELKKVIPEQFVSGVIDGRYTVENKGDFTLTSHAYLQFFDGGQNRIGVCPLRR